jgi:hypothetical protein
MHISKNIPKDLRMQLFLTTFAAKRIMHKPHPTTSSKGIKVIDMTL